MFAFAFATLLRCKRFGLMKQSASVCFVLFRFARTITYMFMLIHVETCGFFAYSALLGIGTDVWLYDGTGTA